ncbi:MAG: hypothetical protein KME20_16100 [Kaiparowitsia implicata GSE-PSE-MK54-09C]|nr:hypothetical protein [Kaiparowitsia implicata GSE-PSE-MK54-09C]
MVEPAVDAVQGGASSVLMLVIGVGFVAAVVLGSIAWYNSKRPAGWEGKERPDIVPKVDK